MTETEKMLAGKIYDASDSYLADRRILAHRLSKQYNVLSMMKQKNELPF